MLWSGSAVPATKHPSRHVLDNRRRWLEAADHIPQQTLVRTKVGGHTLGSERVEPVVPVAGEIVDKCVFISVIAKTNISRDTTARIHYCVKYEAFRDSIPDRFQPAAKL